MVWYLQHDGVKATGFSNKRTSLSDTQVDEDKLILDAYEIINGVGVFNPQVVSDMETSAQKRIARDAAISSGFLWNGVVFQTRPQDLSLIAGRATKIAAKKALNEPVADFYWRAVDNTDHLFTGDEFLRFAVAVDEFVESKYIESWQ